MASSLFRYSAGSPFCSAPRHTTLYETQRERNIEIDILILPRNTGPEKWFPYDHRTAPSVLYLDLLSLFTRTHLFVLGRRRTGVEVVHLVSSAEHRSVISLHWNLQRRVHSPAHPFLAEDTERWAILCWLKLNILPAELNWNSGVLMCLTCLGCWGARCSMSRWPPILLRLDGTRWWPLHHAKCSVHVSPTGQSSMHSSVHTHKQNIQGVVMGVRDKRWRGAVYFKQHAFYSTVT